MWILALTLLAVTIIFIWRKNLSSFGKPDKFPPGPATLPLIGSFPFLPSEVKHGKKKVQTYLQETYGGISGLFLNGGPMIVVSDFHLIKELYKKYEASGRPLTKPFHEARFGSDDGTQRGLLRSIGQEWQEQRRFTIKQLKDLGFGKSTMEDLILEEVDKLADYLEKDVDRVTTLNLKMNLSIVNALWLLLTGQRFSLDDPKLHSIVAKLDAGIRLEGNFSAFDMIIQRISPTLTKVFNKNFQFMTEVFDRIKALAMDSIDEHRQQDENNSDDFLSSYLTAIKETTDVNSSFYGTRGEQSLIANVLDLFLAGTETTSSSLLWAILFLLHYPDVQRQVHAEIDNVVGRHRRVTLEDRANLPYTNAVLMESMRMATIVPNALPHSALDDIHLGNYVIPKGSTVFANILHVHYDPTYWQNPEEFKPERFIDPVTKLYKSDERLIPFSIGKRYCLGQSLAEKEYFLFFASLLQRFDIESPANQVLPRIGRDAGIILGFLRPAPFFDVIISKRKTD